MQIDPLEALVEATFPCTFPRRVRPSPSPIQYNPIQSKNISSGMAFGWPGTPQYNVHGKLSLIVSGCIFGFDCTVC